MADYSLVGSPVYNQAAGVFNPQADVSQSPLMKQLQNLQQQAQRQATTSTMNNMYRSGFGRSTFAPQIAAGAGTQAANPYITQMAQTGQQLGQQNISNFMSLLGLGEQSRQSQQAFDWNKYLQQQALEEEKRKREQTFWNTLLGGGLTALSYGLMGKK